MDRLNFFLDMRIIFLTIKKVLKKEDISDFKTENIEINFDDYRRKQNESKR